MLEAAAVKPARKFLFTQPDTNVYAVFDGASVPKLPRLLRDHEVEYVCLYSGELEPGMAEVAPYLVRLEDEAEFTGWVLRYGWGNHWGIFVTTPAEVSLQDARRHFRQFLMVKDHEGQTLYFRYYDPRVLGVYLPTCNAEELQTIFGPIGSFIIEDDDPSTLLRFWRESEELREERVSLGQTSENSEAGD